MSRERHPVPDLLLSSRGLVGWQRLGQLGVIPDRRWAELYGRRSGPLLAKAIREFLSGRERTTRHEVEDVQVFKVAPPDRVEYYLPSHICTTCQIH